MIPLKIRNNPFHRIGDSYAHIFDRGHFLGKNAFEDSWLTKPLANITRDAAGYHIEVRVPGFEREQIKLEIDDQVIRVIAERQPAEGKEMIHEEFSPTQLARTFELSGVLDVEKISATLEKGILTIFVPFEEHRHVHREIPVN